jgi:hypothetical protein
MEQDITHGDVRYIRSRTLHMKESVVWGHETPCVASVVISLLQKFANLSRQKTDVIYSYMYMP